MFAQGPVIAPARMKPAEVLDFAARLMARLSFVRVRCLIQAARLMAMSNLERAHYSIQVARTMRNWTRAEQWAIQALKIPARYYSKVDCYRMAANYFLPLKCLALFVLPQFHH
jgi:hypothetical protein